MSSQEDLMLGTGRRFYTAEPAESQQYYDMHDATGRGITSSGITDEYQEASDSDCSELEAALIECGIERAELEEENENLQGENDELNEGFEIIAKGGTVLSHTGSTLDPSPPEGYDQQVWTFYQSLVVRDTSSGSSVSATYDWPPVTSYWTTSLPQPPGYLPGGSGSGLELRVAGNNGYTSGWDRSPQASMGALGMSTTGDTARIEARWVDASFSGMVNSAPFTVFTVTATSVSTSEGNNDLGFYYLQDDTAP